MAKKFSELRAAMPVAARQQANKPTSQQKCQSHVVGNATQRAAASARFVAKMLAEVLNVQQSSIAKMEK